MPDDPFLREAERRGILTAAQAQDCLRLAAALAEVKVELSIDEIAARKGFVTAEQCAELRRQLARMRVGRYEIVELLGEGAAGVVWQALDTKLDRVVALKVLSQKAQSFPAFRERFAREARIAVTLNHVNIVRGLDFGEADGYEYFAMEFVEGDNAEKRLAKHGRLPEKDVVAMGLDVVRALVYVQKFNVVHHDIKPSNLLIAAGGHVKLCDLGLAKPMLAESELMAGDGQTAGTPYYMSPEQIQHPERVDWRSDVYSLGATLYHLLTGEPPFRGDSRKSLLHKHVHETAASPREHVLEITDQTASVVMRMLQKAPEDRYASLEDLAADFEAILAGREPRHASGAPPAVERHGRKSAHAAVAAGAGPARPWFPWTVFASVVMVTGGVLGIGIVVSAVMPKSSATATVPAAASPPATSADGPPAAASTPAKPAVVEATPPVAPPGPPAGMETKAASELDGRFRRSLRQSKEGHFAAARGELEGFAQLYPGTEAARSAEKELARIDSLAAAQFDEIVKRAVQAATRRRLDDANALVDEAAKIEVSWAPEKAKTARAELEAIAKQFEQGRADQAPLFDDLYARALLAAGQESVFAARGLVDAEGPRLDAFGREVSALREDLEVLGNAGTDPDTIDGSSARGATALLLARLARGKVAEADAGVEALVASGGEGEEARVRIGRLRDHLARRAAKKLDDAEAALASKDVDLAAKRVNEAHLLAPGTPRERLLAGRVRMAQNDFDQAAVIFSDSASVRDAPPETHLWLARALRAKGDEPIRAEAEYERYLATAPTTEGAARADAGDELKEMRTKRVEAELKRWREAARKADKKNDALRSEGAWGRVAELLQDDDPEALLALGQIYFDKKQQVPAVVALTRVKKLPATDAQKRKAGDLMAKAKASGPTLDDGQEFAQVADKYFAGDNWDRAIQHYQAALLASPHLSAARAKLCRAFLARCREKGNDEEDAKAALDAATTLVQLFPEEAPPLALRAEAQLLLGEQKKAFDDAGAAVKADPKWGPAQLVFGQAALKAGEIQKARDAFTAANRLAPCPQSFLGLARSLVRIGDMGPAGEALDQLKKRYGIPPECRSEYQQLADAIPGYR